MHAYIDKQANDEKRNNNVLTGAGRGLGGLGVADYLAQRKKGVGLKGMGKFSLATSALGMGVGAYGLLKS